MNVNANPQWDARPARQSLVPSFQPPASRLQSPVCPRSPHRHGVALIVVAIMMIVFIGFLGLAIDWLYTVRTAQQLQAAADASALQGAMHLPDGYDAVVTEAHDLALLNFAAGHEVFLVPGVDYTSGDIQVGRYHRVSSNNPTGWFEPTEDSPNSVRVIANRIAANTEGGGELGLLFGGIFKVPSVPITRDAVAMLGPGAAIIVLDPNAACSCTLTGSGSESKLDVQNGIVQVNSDDPKAMCHSGKPTIDADAFSIVGETDKNFEQVLTDDPVLTDQEVIPDPLYPTLHPNPLIPSGTPKPEINVNGGATVNIEQGYYPLGIKVTNGTLNMAPGRYLIDGPGFYVNGGNLNASGVLLYIMDSTSSDTQYSSLYLGGNGTIHISELQDGSIYSGLAIWQAYGNYADAKIIGTDATKMDLQGTLYFPDTGMGTRQGQRDGLYIGGDGGSLGNQLITNKLTIAGNGTVSIDYDGRNNNMTNVFLVE